MKVIILAAGMGSRLQKILKGNPKPLFDLGNKSLIEHSLEALATNGIDDVSIALGFEGEKIKDKIGLTFREMKITYCRNEHYSSTGSMHSFYKTLKTPQDCIVLDGDIIYHPKAIGELLKANGKSSVILTDCCGSDDEVYVTLHHGRLDYLGKSVPNEKEIFEFTGISRFSADFVSKMFALHETNLNQDRKGDYYEDCAYEASKTLPWNGIVMPDLAWSEVDKEEDVQRALNALRVIKNS